GQAPACRWHHIDRGRWQPGASFLFRRPARFEFRFRGSSPGETGLRGFRRRQRRAPDDQGQRNGISDLDCCNLTRATRSRQTARTKNIPLKHSVAYERAATCVAALSLQDASHMAVSAEDLENRIVYVNGEYVPARDARISIFDRGFLFGDGIYEVTAVLEGKLIDSEPHMRRLRRSTGEIGIPMPMDENEIVAVERELIRRNNLTEGLVYLQVTRGDGRDR